MKIISADDLYDRNYSVDTINALKQHWHKKSNFNCIGMPKEKNLFMLLCGCKAEYTLYDKTKILCKDNDIVYVPIGSEYNVRFFDFEDSESHTIGINFLLFDETNTQFILSNKITVFDFNSSTCSALFEKICKYGETAVIRPSKNKAVMYEILSVLSEKLHTKNLQKDSYKIISAGIKYLEHNDDQSLSIKDIAKLCNVSEVYFRRLFKKYSGMSPVEFRIKSRIEKAKIYLEYEGMSVSEISERLGFISPAYFTQQFKKYTGMTPTNYKGVIAK